MPCNPENKKAKLHAYICNEKTNRWILSRKKSPSKRCNPKSPKANNSRYSCNTTTWRWNLKKRKSLKRKFKRKSLKRKSLKRKSLKRKSLKMSVNEFNNKLTKIIMANDIKGVKILFKNKNNRDLLRNEMIEDSLGEMSTFMKIHPYILWELTNINDNYAMLIIYRFSLCETKKKINDIVKNIKEYDKRYKKNVYGELYNLSKNTESLQIIGEDKIRQYVEEVLHL